ncbi:MAG TPA: hypothetical protein VE961_17095 [Pyrinomonadaceae bacterium]|nr:hypothetical protein [Pyrinomonadaceae bacterium]
MLNRLTIVSLAFVVFACAPAGAQSLARPSGTGNDSAAVAISALSRLDAEVIVYRSLGEFEAGRKLARVPLAAFEQHVTEACAELTPLLKQMPASELKNDLTNAIDSYRDGLFWWKQSEEPRVVNIATLRYATPDPTPADAAWHATIPYTVAIHWRQAHRYLDRAERAAARR